MKTGGFVEPSQNVLQMGLREGMKVGDFGAGAGHYALAAARIVGNTGKVYAIDVQEDVLVRLNNEAQRLNVRNVKTIWGDVERPGGTRIKDGTLDAVILSNTLFQLRDKGTAVTEARRVLKPGGTLLLVDWAGAYGGLGPHPDHVVSEHAAEALVISGGFHKRKSFRAGPHHYAVVFSAP